MKLKALLTESELISQQTWILPMSSISVIGRTTDGAVQLSGSNEQKEREREIDSFL